MDDYGKFSFNNRGEPIAVNISIIFHGACGMWGDWPQEGGGGALPDTIPVCGDVWMPTKKALASCVQQYPHVQEQTLILKKYELLPLQKQMRHFCATE